MTPLQRLLADAVVDSGRRHADLAAETGYSTKHLSQMLNGHTEGTLTAWQRLLDAAGVSVGS